jgi:hypothetical protein
MIPVSLRTFLVVGLAIVCGLLLLLWIWIEWRQSARESRLRKSQRRCPLCFYEFRPPHPGQTHPCPRCQAPTV